MSDSNEQGDGVSETSSTHPTTTNAEAGSGHPRLVFVIGSENWDGTPAREFALLPGTTTIGSTPDADLRLDGLDPVHARIEHNDRDEYVLTTTGVAELENFDDLPDMVAGHVLRNGARVDLGLWKMVFARDEFADHGRPYGGREGGELAHQRPQPPRDDSGANKPIEE